MYMYVVDKNLLLPTNITTGAASLFWIITWVYLKYHCFLLWTSINEFYRSKKIISTRNLFVNKITQAVKDRCFIYIFKKEL